MGLLGDTAIARGRFRPQPKDTGKQLRVNHQIRKSPIRLIDEENEQLGVVELDEALRRALDAGLDLVEVAGNSDPPVCRVMDYGKWKYQQRKKEQKARSHSKQSELKEVRLRPKIDEHDLLIKTAKARQFLTEGDKVQFTLQFRGREMAHKELGIKTLRTVREMLAPLSKVEIEPRLSGRRMTMVLVPDQRAKPHGSEQKPSKSKNTQSNQSAAADGSVSQPAPAAPTEVSEVPSNG